ncbi:MAG TPA: right-handed parallel beta-helix repeat-containing protein [bacterium]|nr:right-handed parallel beta-helix repeat-containing protein [bacterium]
MKSAVRTMLIVCALVIGLTLALGNAPAAAKTKATDEQAPSPYITKIPRKDGRPGTSQWIVKPAPQVAAVLRQVVALAQPGDRIVLTAGDYLGGKTDSTVLNIADKNDLEIVGQGTVNVLSRNPGGWLLDITRCNNIVVENIRFGHLLFTDTCQGGVADLGIVRNVTLRNCVFHGSGFVAVTISAGTNVTVEGCALIDCTALAISMDKCKNVRLRESVIAGTSGRYYGNDEHGNIMRNGRAFDVVMEKNLFIGNRTRFDEYEDFVDVALQENVFADNMFTIPDKVLTAGKNKQLAATGDLSDLLNNKELFPTKLVREAAQRTIEFRMFLKKRKAAHVGG